MGLEWLSSSAWRCCWKPQVTMAVRLAVSRSVVSCWSRQAPSMALCYWDQACLSCSRGSFRRGGRPWSTSSWGLGGRFGMVRGRCKGLLPAGPSGSGLCPDGVRGVAVVQVDRGGDGLSLVGEP